MRFFIPIFVIVPAIELYLLHSLSDKIGLLETVLLVVFTGVLGGNLAKREGLRVWHAWQNAMTELRPPEEGVVSGLLVFIGGAFLLTPGVLTDALGLALLVPSLRRPIANALRDYAKRKLEAKGAVVMTPGDMFGGGPGIPGMPGAGMPGAGPGPRPAAGSEPRQPPSAGGVVNTSGEAVSDSDD